MTSRYEQDYLDLCQKLLDEGTWLKNERTGRYCLTLPSVTFTYDVGNDPLPLLTTKQSYPVSAWAELLGYLRRYEWADKFALIGAKTWYVNANETLAWLNNPNRLGENHVGKVYGAALEDWELPELFDKLTKHEDDRGLMINFWRPDKFKLGALRPCMYSHLFSIVGDTLHLISSQRSCDVACGKNFNALQVYMLLAFFAHITGLKAGIATHEIVNPHIYDSHIEGIKEQLGRKPLDSYHTFKINGWVESFEDLVECDTHAREYFKVENYKPLGKIAFDLVA